MKKTIITALTLAVLSLTGCGQSGTTANFSQKDIALTINEFSYQYDADIQTVIAALGEDYEYSEGKSCDYDGLDKTYNYEIAEFYTYPAQDGDRINEIYTQSADVTTSKGITVGAVKEEVVAAYGEPTTDDGFQLIYQIEEPSAPGGKAALCFDLTDNAVSAIYITTQTQALGG